MQITNARYGNASGDVIECEIDGVRWALPASDPMLQGIEAAPFVPPADAPPAPTRAELLAKLEQIAAQIAALPQD